MKFLFMQTVVILLAALLVASCASALDRTSEIGKAQLVIGETTKSEITNMIGLPARVKHDHDNKTELWIYESKGYYKATFLEFPIITSGMVVLPPGVNTKNSYDPSVTSLHCRFNDSGVLIEAQKIDRSGDK